jgi:hypothetical protein
MDPNTHSTQQPGSLDRLAAVVDQLATEDLDALPDAEAAQRVLVLRGCWSGWKASGCGSWPGWTAAAPPVPTRAPRPSPPPAGSAIGPGWATRRPPPGPGRPRVAPRPVGRHGAGAGRRGAQLLARGGVDSRHPGPAASDHHRRRTGAAGGGAAVGPAPGCARWSATSLRSPTRMPPTSGPNASMTPVAVAVTHLGGHGRHRRAAGPRGRRDPPDRIRTARPSQHRRGRPQRGAAPRGCVDRVGPPPAGG